MSAQSVYFFGNGKAEGNASLKNLLGGKGANLAEMTNLGLPVPSGFTISTTVCTDYYKNNRQFPDQLKNEVSEKLTLLEKSMGAKFGDPSNPLLVSVRSGARVSMPGMMDTILNLGLNDETVAGLEKKTNNPRFAWDSYRRFIQMYANVVLNFPTNLLENELEELKEEKNYTSDTEVTAEEWRALCQLFKKTILEQSGSVFPQSPTEQLWGAISAVFSSWMNPRAITYRKLNEIPEEWGTAVNIQSMVFGNMGDDCATGVAFTRNPSNGENKFFGEFLINAQGEDVVAGIRTPQPIEEMQASSPKAYEELIAIQKKLEAHYKDMQDIEFTIQNSKLYMLQTRTGKRTAHAAVRIAVEMVKEGLITKKETIKRIEPSQLDQLLHPMIDPDAKKTLLAKGLPASPGAATGRVVFDPETAEKWAKKSNDALILVRIETSPEDIAGMNVSKGILTARGGMTSHAAVVARGMGKCCVAGCSPLKISYERLEFSVGDYLIKEGDWITLDGTSGEVYLGKVGTIQPTGNEDFAEFMSWADSFKRLKVRANADTPQDSEVARGFGAEGIGLCRTEHMFFNKDRIAPMREMILAETKDSRLTALSKLLPMQREDFIGIFKAMSGLPVTIRLLDPPLHEFLPTDPEDIENLCTTMGVSIEYLNRKIESLHEFNPMLGHRGCRLGISYPEIYQMQARAIFEAAAHLLKTEDLTIEPEIMIPLVGHPKELSLLKKEVIQIAKEIEKENNTSLTYHIGTMIELPRAALCANEIAKEADFFSFGTNDLTQTTLGLSRDDSGSFIGKYVEDYEIYEKDPFQSLDQAGVGQLVKMGFERGRSTSPKLKVGVCGEHGGDPKSIHFFDQVGLDYVSCSPYRVPIARLAAAQAALATRSD